MAEHYLFPPMIERHCDNGLEIVLIPDREQPAMIITLQIPVGKFADKPGFEGTAELLLALMQKGTKELGFEEFSQRFEYTGSSIFAEADEEHIVIGCRMLSRFADTILPLYRDMIRRPALRNEELKILKRELTAALQAESADPSILAHRHFNAELFGTRHPAGRTHTVKSVKNISAGIIENFYTDTFSPEGCCLVIAGDFDPGRALEQWVPLFSSWKNSGETPKPDVTGAGREPAGVVRLVHKPELTQTSLILGHEIPGELHPNRNELALANYILGGGNFSSRLVAEIRSRMGRTYGISSQASCCRNFGTFTIGTSTQSGQVREMVDAILNVYRKFSEEGVTGEELKKAKQFAGGNMAFQLEGIGNVTEKLLWLKFYGREKTYIERFPQIIAAIERDSLNDTIRRFLSHEHIIITAVGNRKEIMTQLAGYGQVTVYDARSIV